MKKKIIGIAVAASLMLTGVVSAASMWGSYKGNDIIRITSNGVAIKTTDVPAINYNGRTMIPINMLSQLGIPYTWDQANKTVDVTTQQVNVTSTDNIKNAIKYADYFHSLENLGEYLIYSYSSYDVVADYVISTIPATIQKTPGVISDANNSLNTAIKLYNKLNEQANLYDDADINYILKNYYEAIESFKTMDSYLNKYTLNKTTDNYKNFLDYKLSGVGPTTDASEKAEQKYSQYINIALNSKYNNMI